MVEDAGDHEIHQIGNAFGLPVETGARRQDDGAGPGQTQLTRMPYEPRSRAIVSDIPATAALDAV